MSTYTYKLKGARWLRMWTAADRSSVYAAQSEAQKIADTLCDVPWTRAKSDGPAMFPLTAAKSLDENPANRDLFDAALFCADHSDGAHRAYANAAMYLFELPTTTGVHLNSVKVHVESDAYNALGARIAVHQLSSAELPTDCATVRTGAAHAEGVASRRTVERDGRNYWYSNSADVTITGGTSESPAAIGDLKQYLAVFVGLENYATSRNEWLEGASYIRNLIEIETDAVVTGWMDGGTYDCSDAGTAVLLSGGSSPTWLQPLPTVNAGETAPEVPTEELVEHFFAADTRKTALQFSRTVDFQTSRWEGTVTMNFRGKTCLGGEVKYNVRGYTTEFTGQLGKVNGSNTEWDFLSPNSTAYNGLSDWLCVNISRATVTMQSNGVKGTTSPYIKAYDNAHMTARNYRHSGSTMTDKSFGSQLDDAYLADNYYVMLELTDGILTDAAYCDAQDASSRSTTTADVDIEGSASPWTVTIDGTDYTVTKSGTAITLKQGSTMKGAWSSVYGGSTHFFDPSVSLHISNTDVSAYGIAPVLGDFSHAVATFESGSQPPDAEVLGRLARMSRKDAGPMLYLHPESGALADELDVLRPVPRFFRVASGSVPSQTTCQPGLSVWYRRPATPSAAALATGYSDDGAAISVIKVTNPAFFQLALLALRAPSAFGTRLVLQNFKPDTTTPTTNVATAVTNHFKLRFVAWRSPAEQWDGSNAFAMAAMASMPSIYRSDGDGSVAWSVDCTGGLLHFGARAMTAERIGISKTIIGDIAASAKIEIPIASPVGEGDVVLIAPEVLGFADGEGGASKWFGRPSDPSLGTAGWARYAHNLGWFPRVTGE